MVITAVFTVFAGCEKAEEPVATEAPAAEATEEKAEEAEAPAEEKSNDSRRHRSSLLARNGWRTW